MLLTLCMVFGPFAAGTAVASAQGGELTGNGTAETPYQIQDAADLMAFITLVEADPDACAVLTGDIDVQDLALTAAPIYSYEGTFDGDGHTIRGLTIGGTGGNKAIFRTLSEGGVVKDLNVSGAVSGTSNVAGIVVTNYGTIENCSFTGTVTGTSYPVGGIVAQNSGQIIGCTNHAAVTGAFHVGGIAGRNGSTSAAGSIEDSVNQGAVTGTNETSASGGTGGIAGTNFDLIDGCQNLAAVTGCKYAGGITGYNQKASGFDTMVINSHNAGDIQGLQYAGGVAGYQFGAKIASCYNEGSVSAAENAVVRAYIGGIVGCMEAASSNPTTVSHCYNTGTVTASGTSQRAGGIVGANNSSGAVIEACYNIATASNSVNADNAGSIAGSNAGTVRSCVYLTSTTAIGSGSGATADLTPAEEAALSQAETFAAWPDFDTYWTIDPLLGRPVLTNASESGGQGTEEIPYEIPDLDTLMLIRDRVEEGFDFSGYYFTLSADLDLQGSADNPWTPIGTDNMHPFNGIFDGGGHTIRGLYIDSNSDNQGLFGYIGNSGAVKNLTVAGQVTTTGQLAGGIVGANRGDIINCHSTVDVTGSMQVGGIAGINRGTIERCTYTAGTVTGEMYQGGIAGYNEEGTITDSYNRGEINGGDWTGGIAGSNANLIKNCYSVGEHITGLPTTGVTTGTVLNSYYLAEQEEATTTGTGKTAEQFASGEVTWLLNEGKTDATQTFYQTCGEGYPEYTGDTVYQITNYHCPGDKTGVKAYSNHSEGTTGTHRFTAEIEAEAYLHTAGTCTKEALYYKSCEYCGEASPSETFTGQKDPSNHAHLVKVEAKPATYEAAGNIEYWRCEDCGKYFGDAAGTKEITPESTILEKLTQSPQTGSSSDLLLFGAVILFSGAAMLFLTLKRARIR